MAEAKASTRQEEPDLEVTRITRENVDQVARGLPFHARILIGAVTRMRHGSITFRLPDGHTFHYQAPEEGPAAVLQMHNWRLPRRTIMGGSIGAAESYMDGDWDSPDVTELLALFSVNNDVGNELTTPNWLNNIIETLRHWWHENTPSGSKRNIAAHYDLGNNFYSRWLDSTMTYSSAIYDTRNASLKAAQNAKYRSLIERTEIRQGDHVLEIGCGWGGFAEYAAKNTGCKVTGLTISRQQYDFARERMFREGLNERVDIKFQDYRDETGTYDRIASIEMFEAVGEKYWSTYFDRVRQCLNPGGKAGLQIITIADASYELYRKRPDFIQRYIFPGGMLPPQSLVRKLGEDAGLACVAERIFPLDYARTLAEWRQRFLNAWEEIRPLGFDERFRRMWAFYLHYCEAGFKTGNIDVRQVFFSRD
ncbi:MAG: cyclopropane-fatty-acyl-phospholipid synthase family protein [Rhizobiaceae bacterium]